MIRIHNENGSTTVIKPRIRPNPMYIAGAVGFRSHKFIARIDDPVTGEFGVGYGDTVERAYDDMVLGYRIALDAKYERDKTKWFWPLFLSASSITFIGMMVWNATH